MKKRTGLEIFFYSAYGYEPRGYSDRLLGFSGYWRDFWTNCYPLGNGYRMFNPRIRRFNSPDELSPFGAGGINAYMYCNGDPVNKKDESGRAGGEVTTLLKGYGLGGDKKHIKPFLKMLDEGTQFKFHHRSGETIRTFEVSRTAAGLSLDTSVSTQALPPPGNYLQRKDLFISWHSDEGSPSIAASTGFTFIKIHPPVPAVTLNRPSRTLAQPNDYLSLPSVVGGVREDRGAGSSDGSRGASASRR